MFFRRIFFLGFVFFLFSFPSVAFGASALYSVGAYGPSFYEIDPDTYEAIDTISLTDADGGNIGGFNGVAVDPTTNTIYVIVRVEGGRFLATADLGTNIVTRIGNLGDNFAALAFDGNGLLYGLTGDGAATASSLFSIDPSNASKTLLASYTADSDGEALSFNSDDGLLYRATGNDIYAIDPSDPENPVTITENNGELQNGCVSGLYHESGDSFLWICPSNLYSFDVSTGEVSYLAEIGGDGSKGFFSYSPGPLPTSLSPIDDAFNVSQSVQPSIVFNQIVERGSGNITLKKVSNGSTTDTISVDGSRVTGWGTNTLTFSFSPDFAYGAEYAIWIDETAVRNGNEFFFDGFSDNTSWSFTVRPEGSQFSFLDSFLDENFIDTDETDAQYDGVGSYSLEASSSWGYADGVTPGKESVLGVASQSMVDNSHIVLDSSGHPLVVWHGFTGFTDGEDDIYLSRWNGSEWTKMDGTAGFENVSNTDGASDDPQVLLDSSGDPVIVWNDDTTGNNDIYLSRWNGSEWTKMDGTAGSDNISNSAGYSYDPQVLLDSSDNPSVAWYDDSDGNGEIYFSRWNGSQWAKMDGSAGSDNISNSAGTSQFPLIVFDALDIPIIVWSEIADNELRLTRWNGSAWSKMDGTVGSDVIYSLGYSLDKQLVLDPIGSPVVVSGDAGNIHLSRWNGSAWSKMDGTAGFDVLPNGIDFSHSPNITYDLSGNPIIVWADSASGGDALYVSRWNGSAWSKMDGVTPGSELVGENGNFFEVAGTHIFQLSDGRVLVGWHSQQSESMHAVFWNGSDWVNSLGEVGSNDDLSGPVQVDSSDIVVDSNDVPYAVWTESDGRVYFSRLNEEASSEVQSENITGFLDEDILTATLSADDDTPGASRIEYFLSNDGGSHWTEAESGEPVTFSTTGSDLRWRAVLFRGSVPTLYSVSVSYAIAASPDGASNDADEDPDSDQDLDLLSISSITDTSLILHVRTTDDFDNEKVDFKVRVRNVDTGEVSILKFEEKVSKKNLASLLISDLTPDTTYSFRVKLSRNGKNDYGDYSNKREATTLPSEPDSKASGTDEGGGGIDDGSGTGGTDDGTGGGTGGTDDGGIGGGTGGTDGDTGGTGGTDEGTGGGTTDDGGTTDGDGGQDETSNAGGSSEKREEKGNSSAQDSRNQRETIGASAAFRGVLTTVRSTLPESKPRAAAVVFGALAGLALLASSTAVPFLSLSPAGLVGKGVPLLGLFLGRRKTKEWGIVFDAATKRPVSGAIVMLRDADKGNVLNTCVTDSEGRYGFFVNAGSYIVSVMKGKYTLRKGVSLDPLYGSTYDGNIIAIPSGKTDVIIGNIALELGDFDWNSFARKTITASKSWFSLFLKYSFPLLFAAGMGISAWEFLRAPSPLNSIPFFLYLAILPTFFIRKKKFGTVIRGKEPVPFAQVELWQKENRVAFAVTDLIGRYFLLVPPGEYRAIIKGASIDRVPFERSETVYLVKGLLRMNWNV